MAELIETPASNEVFAKVVPGGYCIGCGNCAFASAGAVTMQMNAEGFVQAQRSGDAPVPDAVDRLCPFSDAATDETQLATQQPWNDLPQDPRTGFYGDLYAGHVSEQDDRLAGGSGGMTSWFLRQLLLSGEVDHVVHVKPVDPTTDPQGRMFRYAISSDVAGLEEGRKSRYYPVDLADIYALIRDRPGRYAVVAIPCFAKAIRLMQGEDAVIADRVRFVAGLICGHLKSRSFAEYVGWLQGVRPTDLRYLDFRVKIPGEDASRYTVEAHSDRAVKRGEALKEYFGTTWDLGFMKYNACEYCDDVFAETADIVFGDAWIEPFQASWMGSNVVLTRHPTAARIVAQGIADGSVTLTPIPLSDMAKSQASGLRHRREGLAYRLSLVDRSGGWRPRKRFEQAAMPHEKRQAVYRMRTRIAASSARYFARLRTAPTLAAFQGRISGEVFQYYRIAGGLKPAITQSVPVKWLRRWLKTRRR